MDGWVDVLHYIWPSNYIIAPWLYCTFTMCFCMCVTDRHSTHSDEVCKHGIKCAQVQQQNNQDSHVTRT